MNQQSSTDIEEQIKEYRLLFFSERLPEVEQANLPMFADAISDYVEAFNKMPSQDEFVAFYFKQNNFAERTRGVEARIRRAYPSLVRDYHFASLLYEEGLGTGYNRDIDVEDGVDHLITYKGYQFKIHCFVETKSALEYRGKKDNRHVTDGNHIDISLNMSSPETKKIGDFYLFSREHIERIKETIDDYLGITKPVVTNKILDIGYFM